MKNKDLLSRRVAEVIDKENLNKRLKSKQKLRVKLGIDPTGSRLHLGHAVPLWKLREFQDAGHTAVFIVGDYTARIGDPSGKNETREALSEEEIAENSKTFFDQAYKILDKKKTEVHMQSEWYEDFGLKKVIQLMSNVTESQIMAHETFRQRLEKDLPFYHHETLYPLIQGYDSVAVEADVELGAIEQKFNLLMGRTIQRAYGQKPQDIVMLDYLIGLDGKQKMGKTTDNFIAILDSPEEMFGKSMSISDDLIEHYFEMCTDLDIKEIKQILGKENPRDQKARLGREIVAAYHSEKEAEKAEAEFDKKFAGKKGKIKPDFSLKKKPGTYSLVDVLAESELAGSKSEAKRKIKEGAVDVDGQGVREEQALVKIKKGTVIRLGKRFLKIE